METLRFGLIGCGGMGREFVSAVLRWCHLPEMKIRPEIVAICNRTLGTPKMKWFTDNLPNLRQVTGDYRELLDNKQVEAVFIAVPHNLHEEHYCAALDAGKHLLGEKPFGINKKANAAILEAVKRHPKLFVRCVSQYLFFPAVQRIGELIEADVFGRIMRVNAGFLHCSDLNPKKPINWKRQVATNGEYGCIGDLGPHAVYVPLRAGWIPRNVRAVLTDVIHQRKDAAGNTVPCDTWDNGSLLCEAASAKSGDSFPLTLRMERISPGQKNNWYLEVLGTKTSVRYSTKEANTLEIMEYAGGEQAWQRIDMGHEVAYPSVTPATGQFGMSDSLLQMWAAYLYEFHEGKPPARFAGCVTPDETALCHRLLEAALQSHKRCEVVPIE